MPLRIEELLRAEAYPHPVGRIVVRETHISWVVLTGSLAYKIKKPVHYDFIDATTLQQRHRYCCEELRLNRRLAPELYEQVVAITRAQGHAMIGGDGQVIEYAVRMKQFDAAQELPTLLARNDVSVEECAALGGLLARFHREASIATWNGCPEKTQQMRESVLDNLRQLTACLAEPALTPLLNQLLHWTLDHADTLQSFLQQREQSSLVREGHGDLHCANIVRAHGRLTPFDCIEFDARLRWIDPINDIAFLVMDLISRGRADLAFSMLSRYLEETGDYEGIRALPFFAVHRALVRAKVDALTALQVPARAAEFQQRLQERIRAAIHWTEYRPPLLVLMHGYSGSGKSWLSERLVAAIPAIRLRSDVERKRLAGLESSTRMATQFRHGWYSDDFNHRTYARLADCAETGLRAGLNMIVDATFLDAADRQQFTTLATRLGLPHLIVACHADQQTLASRIRTRSEQAADASDADLAILDAQQRSASTLSEAERSCVINVDTREADVVQRVAAAAAHLLKRSGASRYLGKL